MSAGTQKKTLTNEELRTAIAGEKQPPTTTRGLWRALNAGRENQDKPELDELTDFLVLQFLQSSDCGADPSNTRIKELEARVTELGKRPDDEEVELLLSQRADISPDDWGAAKAKIEELEKEAEGLRARPDIKPVELQDLRVAAETLGRLKKVIPGIGPVQLQELMDELKKLRDVPSQKEGSAHWANKLFDSQVLLGAVTCLLMFVACFFAIDVFFRLHPLHATTPNAAAVVQKPEVGDAPIEEDPYEIEMRAMKSEGKDTPQTRKD
ncbi:MAG: hypothetical protein ABIP54_03105 [Candidatus Andersenbacteria bacterium]